MQEDGDMQEEAGGEEAGQEALLHILHIPRPRLKRGTGPRPNLGPDSRARLIWLKLHPRWARGARIWLTVSIRQHLARSRQTIRSDFSVLGIGEVGVG